MKESGLHNFTTIYFAGIGGIGMSGLAAYFLASGVRVGGYDRVSSDITCALEQKGAWIQFSENIEELREWLGEGPYEKVLLVHTPAVSQSSPLFSFFQKLAVFQMKRAEVLGRITQSHVTIAVAGTHGKTTTSTMIAHLLISAGRSCTAFLGGLSSNYQTNFIQSGVDAGDSLMVVEADEFDRSFLHLSPDYAVITSVDADHLDIYHDEKSFKEGFQAFTGCIPPNGFLLCREGLEFLPVVPPNGQAKTYGFSASADFFALNERIKAGKFHFSFSALGVELNDLEVGLPGRHNLENAVAAVAIALRLGLSAEEIRCGLKTFRGVKRRFELIYEKNGRYFIDDYAHHPTEIEACLKAVRELYPGKKIAGVFQPHLFSRTRDFADAFAKSLSMLDDITLMEIYPAREQPLSGIDASFLLDKIPSDQKRLLKREEVPAYVSKMDAGVLITLGAGDIDQLVQPILEKLVLEW